MTTDAERLLYYGGMGLTAPAICDVEEMRRGSPSRLISQRGMKNTIVDLSSRKNTERRTLESYSVEFLFALELEIFGTCYEYYAQVQPKNIDRYGKTSTAHIDVMVFDPACIRLVECKPHEKLLRLASSRPDEWVHCDGVWTRPALRDWASDRGLSYEIWTPPQPHGVYQANLLALFSFLQHGDDDEIDERYLLHIQRALQDHPIPLSEVSASLRGASNKHALMALAKGLVFGTLKSVPLDEPERFLLYASKEQAEWCDERLLHRLRSGLAQPEVSSALLRARPSDYQNALVRLERIERMLRSEEPTTRRYGPLVKGVLEARAEGRSELEVCLTHYERSGRRVGQLTGGQENLLKHAIAQYRQDPKLRTQRQAHDALRIRCEENEIRPPSRTTFLARLHTKSPLKRAYTEGGYRGFHAAEAAVDPSDRTMRCIVPRLMVHVDSTKFDLRCSPDFLSTLGFDCPTLYLAMDSATGMPLGRAVMYGPSCRNALAVLLRDVLYRQGVLPRYWIVDGGSEYVGGFFAEFCAHTGATHIQPPPGNPRKNSLAENALGRVNGELAHRFLGSTDPDRQGRSVTHRQKSSATACHTYTTVVQHLDHYLFRDMVAVRHGVSRLSPEEKARELEGLFGNLGLVDIQNMDDFLIATSIPIDRVLKVDPSQGIRYLLRRYVSDELLLEARISKPLEMRIDCVNPHRMYVKFPRRWVLASTADQLRVEGRDDLAKLFEHLSDAAHRSENAALKDKQRIERQLRIQEANRAAGSARHLDGMSTPSEHPPKKLKPDYRWGHSPMSNEPFPTEEL